MDPILVEHSDSLLFSSFSGARYLFDAATVSVHPWPWQMTRSQLNALYTASDESLPDAVEEVGAPPDLAAYVRTWRDQAFAFRAARCSTRAPHAAHAPGVAPEVEPPAFKPSPGVMSNLLLVVTDACNLRCRYCIFSGNYDGYHTYRPQKMSWETARQAVDHFLALNDAPPFLAMPKRKLDIVFFGGEPLLEENLIRQVVAYAKSRERSHYYIYLSATTNLTVLPDDLAHFVVENGFGLDVSLDGPREVHDLYRLNSAGGGSFDSVWHNLGKLQRLSPTYFREHVRAMVTLNGNSDLVAVRDFFESGDPRVPRVGFVGTIREMQDGAFHQRYPFNVERFRMQFAQLLVEYHRRKHAGANMSRGDLFYELFERPLSVLYKRIMSPGALRNGVYTSACTPGRRLAVSTDGKFHLCERTNERFSIGDVERGLDLDRCREIQRQYYRSLPDCECCWARAICQFCFAAVCKGTEFEFEPRRCDSMRSELALLLRSLYTALEEAPGGLACGNTLIDHHRLAEEPL